ncbi:hypothetical protein D3C72_1979130 [compost metagenome]
MRVAHGISASTSSKAAFNSLILAAPRSMSSSSGLIKRLMPGFTVSRDEVITCHSEPLSRPFTWSFLRHTSLSPACG